MRIIIYAAGVSRRLKAIAGNGLKGLLELNGKRIIEYQLDWAVKQPVTEVIIVLGLEHELYKEVLGNFYKGVPLVFLYNPDYKDKGNMLSLWCAREFCDRETLFTTSDLICHRDDIAKFVTADIENKILVDSKSKYLFSDSDPVKVTISSNAISNILKDGKELTQIDGVAIGLYHFSKDGINCVIKSIERKISEGNDDLSLYYAIDDVLKEYNVEPVFADKCKWIDIDTPADLLKARELNFDEN
jgi:choline kinase